MTLNESLGGQALLKRDDFVESMTSLIKTIGKNKRYFHHLDHSIKKHVRRHEEEVAILYKKHKELE